MVLGPKVKFRLTAKCGKCDYSTDKTVEVEEINLKSEELKFINEAAKAHNKHPDLNSFKITPVKL